MSLGSPRKTSESPNLSYGSIIRADDLHEGDLILDAGATVKVTLLERYPSIKTLMIMGNELEGSKFERVRFAHEDMEVRLVQSHAEGRYVRRPRRSRRANRSS